MTHTHRISAFLAAASSIALGALSLAGAQTPTVWDGVYTEEQATRGARSFAADCARCHETAGGDEGGRPLHGDAFWDSFRESTVDHLFDYISQSMPNGAGGSLSPAAYIDLTAYILSLNDLPFGDTELTPVSAVGVHIVAETGPGPLPDGTLARTVGCLERDDSNRWVVTQATSPERDSETGAADAARALGNGSYALMFVLTPLDAFLHHRVRVRGLLMGEGGIDGINVSTVDSVSESCE